MLHTAAYVNYGRWVADCPHILCTNALTVESGQTLFTCGWVGDPPMPGCRGTSALDWPEDPAAVMAKLAGRPESEQHWRPEAEPGKGAE